YTYGGLGRANTRHREPPPTTSWTGVLAVRGTASCRRDSNPHTPHRRQGGCLQRTAVTGWSALLNLTTAPGRLCPGRNPRPIHGSDLPGGGKRRWSSQPDAPVGGVVLQQVKVRDVYSARPDSGAIFGSQKRNLGAGSESHARAQRPSQPKKTRLLRVLHSANLLSSRLRLDRTEEVFPCAHLNGLAAYLDIGQVVRVEA